MSVEDAIEVAKDNEVKLFLAISPNNPISAELDFLSYSANMNEKGLLVYTGEARLVTQEDPPRIGLRGTAKLYGDRYPLVYWAFRKPLAYLRQLVGI